MHWVRVLVGALVLAAVSQPAPAQNPTVVLQAAKSLSEDEPYAALPTALVFSPDQKRVGSIDPSGIINLWDADGGRLLRTIRHPSAAAAAFSPDGRRLITLGGMIRSWDVETGRPIHVFDQAVRTTAVHALSGDGLRLVTGTDTAIIEEWDVAAGRKLRELVKDADTGPITAATYSSDGSLIATANQDGSINLWSRETGEFVRGMNGQNAAAAHLIFSTDGRRLVSVAQDGTFALWEVDSARLLRAAKHDYETALAAQSDGRSLRICCGETAALFDLDAASMTRLAIPAIGWINAAAFSRDGSRLIMAGRDGALRLLNGTDGKPIRTFNPPQATTILSVAMSPDGRHVIAGENGNRLQYWDLATAQFVRGIAGRPERLHSVAISADGRRALSGDGITFELWNLGTGSHIRTFETSEHEPRPVLFSPDGRSILAATADGQGLALWSVDDGRPLRSIPFRTPTVPWAAFTPDAQMVAIASGRSVEVFAVADGRQLRAIGPLTEDQRPVGLSHDGRRLLIAGGFDAGAQLWDIASGKRIDGPAYPSAEFYTFSSDGRRLMTHSIEEIQLLHADTGQPIVVVPGLIPFQIPGAFLPDGQSWLSGSYDTTLTLRDVGTGSILRSFAGHTGAVIALALDHDGRRAVTGSPDTTVRLWNVTSGELMASLLATRDGEWIILTPEGFYSASAGGGRLANVVRGLDAFPADDLRQLLHRRDLVVEKLAGDPRGLVRDAAAALDWSSAFAERKRRPN